jgi:hypothetical protein
MAAMAAAKAAKAEAVAAAMAASSRRMEMEDLLREALQDLLAD